MEHPLINKPQTERGKKTLNSIVNAAVQLFYEKGYFHTSISDITKLAGTGTGTFYIYFDGKYSLYKYLLLSCSRMIRKHLTKSIQGCKTRREMERVGMKSWLEFVLSHEYIYGIIWESMYIDRKLFDDYYITFCKSYMKGIAAAPEGEIAEIDPEVMAYSLMGISNFIGLNWGLFRRDTSQEEIDRVVDEYMKILENGIFTDKARAAIRGSKSGSKKKSAEKKIQFHFPLDFAEEGGDIKQDD